MEQFSSFNIEKNQHRKIIGYLGLSLPFLLVLGNFLFGCASVQDSISHYYHTYMRDVLVGLIVLIGLFFITYKGYSKDKIPFKIAGFSVLLVAFFPTALDVDALNSCKEIISSNRKFTISQWIHATGALFFFGTLTYICLFLFTNNKRSVKYKEEKRKHYLIRFCGYIMLSSIIAIAFFLIFEAKIEAKIGDLNLLFYLEVIALFAFSIAWLTKGKFVNALENKTLL